jgi:hypothetical protein
MYIAMWLMPTIGFGLAAGYPGLFLSRHKTTLLSKQSKISDDISFDFSSRCGWEEFYRNQVAERAAFTGAEASSVIANDNDTVADLEWHSSIPLETVAGYCSPIGTTISDDCMEVLVIGCGTSRLPEAILQPTASWSASHNSVRLTLLDSSPTCLRLLEARYSQFIQAGQIRLVCGDAVLLSTTLQKAQQSPSEQECEDTGSPIRGERGFDVIVDKGLMDALLCSEGWDGPLGTLVEQVSLVLRDSSPSTSAAAWVLVTYALASSTKDFLVQRGARVGLAWEFNCAGSNERVEISLARKTS